MGVDFALRLCSRLLVLTALCQGASIKLDVDGTEHVDLFPDEVCPCIAREACPRVFGSLPEDALLGDFSLCEDPGLVRCCGVSTSVSVSSGNPDSRAREQTVPVVPPGIVVPVPFQFPEYVDPRTSTVSPRYAGDPENYDYYLSYENESDEAVAVADAKKDGEEEVEEERRFEESPGVISAGKTLAEGTNRAELSSGKTSRGENIGNGQRSEISSSKRVESTSSSSSSSSSSSKKTESVVTTEDNASSSSLAAADGARPELRGAGGDDIRRNSELRGGRGRSMIDSHNSVASKDLDYAEVEVESDQREAPLVRGSASGPSFNELKSGLRGRTVHSNQQQTSSQQKGKRVREESSNFEESSSSSVSLADEQRGNFERNENIVGRRRRPVATGLETALGSEGSTVYGQRTETSSQQGSSSVNKESTNVQTIATNTEEAVDENLELLEVDRPPFPEIRRHETLNRGSTIYGGQRKEISSQRQSSSVKKESSNVEESTSFNAQTITTHDKGVVNDDTRSDLLEIDQRPVVPVKRPTLTRGNTVYKGQQKVTSSQQQSSSVKEESSKVEENTSSNVKSISTNIRDLVDDDLSSEHPVTTWRPISVVRRPISNRGNVVYRKQKESTSQQQSSAVKEESSNVEESTLSNVQTIATNTEEDVDTSSEVLKVSRRPVPAIRRPILHRGNTVYGGRRKETSSQQQSSSVKNESSNVEESTSSNAQTIATNTEDILDDGESSEILEIDQRAVSGIRRPILNKGNTVYKGQRKEISSQQQSSSVKKEFSNVEENTSSNVQSISTNTGDLVNDDLSSELPATTWRPIPAVRRPISNRGNVVYGKLKETSSKQRSSAVKKESSNVEESISFDGQTIATNTEADVDKSPEFLEDSRRLIPVIRRPTLNRGNTAYGGERKEISSQQQSNLVKTESSKLEESTSTDVQTSITNTDELQYNKVSSELADTGSVGENVVKDHKESSTHEENKSNGSSSFEENTSSNSKTVTSNTEELSSDTASSRVLGSGSIDETNHEQHEETISTEENSKIVTKESSSLEESKSLNIKQTSNVESNEADQNQSSMITQGPVPNSEINRVLGERRETSAIEKNEMLSKESSRSTETSIVSTSNLLNVVTGNQLLDAAAIPNSSQIENTNNLSSGMNREEGTKFWRVANRSYVPVLINAGFLKDRPTATGIVGLDPLSGVTHSDIWDPNLAPQLLPLSCGNVVFGERFRDGKTLICEIPPENASSIRFLRGDERTVSPGKVSSDAVMPSSGSISSLTENTLATKSRVSKSRGEESSQTNTVHVAEIDHQQAPRRRVVKRPVHVSAKEEELPLAFPKPALDVYRGRIRHKTPERRYRPDIDGISSIGSRQFSKESLSASSSTSTRARSSQESVSSSNSNRQELTKSDFDISSTDEYDAERKTEGIKSRFYLLPLAPILPASEKEAYTTAGGELENPKIVEVVDEAPVTTSKVSKKRLRNLSSGTKMPLNYLETLKLKTSEEKGSNAEGADFVVSADDSKSPAFFYHRNTRQVETFAPKVQGATIFAEELSTPGRVNVIGPIPAGYEDPALVPQEQLPIELPVNTGARDFRPTINSGPQIVSRGSENFKPSPDDPIKWI